RSPRRGRRAAARDGRREAAARHHAGARRALSGDVLVQDEDLRAAGRPRPRHAQGLGVPLPRARALPATADRRARRPAAARAALWGRARPDENVEYYQSKVLETWERFRRFTEHDGLVPYVDEAPESSQLSLF